jgi:hypothetical protein
MTFLAEEGDVLAYTCTKQRDIEPFKKILVKIERVEAEDSVVLEWVDRAEDSGELKPKAREALAVLDTHFADDGASATAWLKTSGLTEATFYRHRADLMKRKLVEKVGQRHVLTGQGREALGLPPIEPADPKAITLTELSNGSHESDPTDIGVTLTTLTTLRGESSESSDGRVAPPSGRPKNGVLNAAVDEIDDLPWDAAENYHDDDSGGARTINLVPAPPEPRESEPWLRCSSCCELEAICLEHAAAYAARGRIS